MNRINDYQNFVPNGHKKGDYPDWKKQEDVSEQVLNYFYLVMPNSLKRAIRCFILNCAIRKLRGSIMNITQC